MEINLNYVITTISGILLPLILGWFSDKFAEKAGVALSKFAMLKLGKKVGGVIEKKIALPILLFIRGMRKDDSGELYKIVCRAIEIIAKGE